MHAERIVVAALSAMLVVSGCSGGWHRVEPIAPRTFGHRQQVQVWTNAGSSVVHAVKLDAQSISGVPFTQHPDCDSCRVAIPLATVDSVRLGNKEKGFILAVGAVVGSLLLLGILYCSEGCSNE